MSWDWLKRGGPVSDAVGGGIDFFTGGLTDFDGRGKGDSNLFNPIGGGANQSWGGGSSSDGFNLGDAIQAFTQGYGSQIGPGAGSTPGGSSFLNAYTSGKSSTPTTTSPVSTSSVFTGGGASHSMPGVVINEKPDFYAFKDNVQYPQQGASGSGSAPKKDKFGDFLGKAGQVISIAKFLCDIRTKTDISPLETTEVNDDLAQVAFFVKELRECS
jgi:hypothetical protein